LNSLPLAGIFNDKTIAMEEQLDIFGAKSDPLEKNLLKHKLQTTEFNAGNTGFLIIPWETADKKLVISYHIYHTPVGEILLAATDKGIVYLGFTKSPRIAALDDLRKRFPENELVEEETGPILDAVYKLHRPNSKMEVALHLKGTPYQLAIWEKLLRVPFGGLVNYGKLADNEPDAREIGAAVGSNPVCLLVPCHRVIKADGTYKGYFWGDKKKAELLTYEAAQNAKGDGQ
jgi:AraC family transcriptional regulator, regulatory protein of adaptative response / methylated-DNA-[protein]-cysteine methyltransferase